MTVSLSPNGVITHGEATPPKRLLVATLQGVAILERKDEWRLGSRALEGKHIGSLMVEPRRGGVFAGAHDGGLYFSGDDGATWEKRMNGIDIEHVYSLAYAEEPGGTVLYAGTEPVALYRSEDRGESWREIASYHKEDDFWYKDVHRLVQLEKRPQVFYMTTGMGLYRSTDDGKSWRQLTGRENFRVAYPDHLVVSPMDDRVLFLAGALTDPSTWRTSHYADGTVVVSRDGGESWMVADRGLPANRRANIEAMTMSSYPGGFSLFLGTTDGDVFLSDDGAQSWTRIGSALTPVSKGGHYRHLQDAELAHA